MPEIYNSPDIGYLNVKCLLDISGVAPVINLINQTTPNQTVSPTPTLDDLVWVLNIFSPTGTPIYTSDFDNPFQTGVWETASITNQWPQPFGQIEWSEYTLLFQVKDSNGTIYNLDKIGNICRPVGNTKKSINPYGHVNLQIQVMCQRGSLYIVDNTSKTYQGYTGVNISSYLAVDYPRDPTGVRPDPFTITSFNGDALVPFTFNGANFEATYYSIYEYDLGNDVFVRIRYTAQRTFPVQCNIDLCAIGCELAALESTIENGTCTDVVVAQQKVNKITPKLLRAFIAQEYPACGVDLVSLVNEIIAIGGFKCDCSGVSSGIGQSAVSENYLFSVVSEGGDIRGHFTVTGGNVVLYLSDKSYTFGECGDTQTDAISLVSKTTGSNIFTCLKVNIHDLAEDLYSATASNVDLLNQFNELIFSETGNFKLIVDGGTIFQSMPACDYIFRLSNIPSNTTFAIITSIAKSAVVIPLNFAFNKTNLGSLQTYLNSLGYGSFIVNDLPSGDISITSDTNPNSLSDLTYKVGVTNYIALLSKDCTGFIPMSANEVVQNIINYLEGLDDTEVITSESYEVCFIDADGKKQTTTVNGGVALNVFITTLLEKKCTDIDYILTLKPITCDNIKEQFPQSNEIMLANDIVLGTKNGSCAEIFPLELFTRMVQLAAFDNAAFNAFCQLSNLCRIGYPCTPFTVFTLNVIDHSPNDNEQDIIVTFQNLDSQFVGVNIYYNRQDVTIPPTFGQFQNVLPGASPFTIPNLPQGQYRVGLQPVFSDGRSCPIVYNETISCTQVSAFIATFDGTDINVEYTLTAPKIKINVYYPNGSTTTQIFNNGDSIAITPPAGLYGNYTLTAQTVCNQTTGFFSAPTAPVVINIAQPTASVTAIAQTSLTAGVAIQSIAGVTGFALSGILTNGATQTGTHVAFTNNTLVFNVSGSPTVDDGVDITIDGSFFTRVEFTAGAGLYSLPNVTADGTQTVLLDFNNDA